MPGSLSAGSVNTTPNCSSDSSVIVHQVVILDELATERWIRWDDSTDKFQESCWEHNHKISLTFSSEKELNLIYNAIQNNEVHLASKVHIYYSKGAVFCM